MKEIFAGGLIGGIFGLLLGIKLTADTVVKSMHRNPGLWIQRALEIQQQGK